MKDSTEYPRASFAYTQPPSVRKRRGEAVREWDFRFHKAMQKVKRLRIEIAGNEARVADLGFQLASHGSLYDEYELADLHGRLTNLRRELHEQLAEATHAENEYIDACEQIDPVGYALHLEKIFRDNPELVSHTMRAVRPRLGRAARRSTSTRSRGSRRCRSSSSSSSDDPDGEPPRPRFRGHTFTAAHAEVAA